MYGMNGWNKPGGDSISRQAAIDAVLDRMNIEKYGRNAKPEEIRWTLEKLPSAQPSSSCVRENDTISRRMAIDAIFGRSHEIIKMRIENLPSAQPEIIHCRECKHWREDHTCREHSLVSPMMAYEFCSRAERREE